MAPALTDPISHRQSKISSPAQASSPRPIISDVTEQTQTTTAIAATTSPHHRLATQQNGGGVVVSLDDNFAAAKETSGHTAAHAAAAVAHQIENSFLENDNGQGQAQEQDQLRYQSPKKNNQVKDEQHQQFGTPDFHSIFEQQIQTSNGYVECESIKKN